MATRTVDQQFGDGEPYTASFVHISKRPTFITGLKNAGFDIREEDVQFGQGNTHGHKRMNRGKDSNADLLITFQSTSHGKAVMHALWENILEGRSVVVNKAKQQLAVSGGRNPKAAVPTAEHIRMSLSDAYHERAFRDEFEKMGLESALAKQAERVDIFHPANPPASQGRTTRGGRTVIGKAVQKYDKKNRRKDRKKAKRNAESKASAGRRLLVSNAVQKHDRRMSEEREKSKRSAKNKASPDEY